MKVSRLVVVWIAVLMVSCAPASMKDAGSRPIRQPNVLTQEEIRSGHFRNVFDAVAALRGNWLARRGAVSFRDPTAGQVLVFMHGQRIGGVDYLRQVSTAHVISVQFLNPTEAAAQFGLRTSSGPVIIVDMMPRQ